ncbi:uncharacterized protein LOC18015153 isoform X4 [Eutrema salsugineum]|uniref:uncharacterized protein LOC18015153 isoform X4 n=1 Tax=Eutrema salsugineum TaxID=72664 RepID=UPI000CECFF64|nr:uncharacterized protein LOC18015153 isoform X4 [Eutrema salsugineum]
MFSYLILRGFHNLTASVVEIGLGLSSSRYMYPFVLYYTIKGRYIVYYNFYFGEPLTISKDRSLLLRRTNVDDSSVSMCLASLEILVNVLSTNFAFVLSFALAAKIMLVMSVDASRRKEILLGILISSYVKIFLFAMPVWDIPVSVIFIVDMLVLTSNAVALKVMTDSTTSRCLAACFMAHSIRFLADQISGSRSLKHLGSVM